MAEAQPKPVTVVCLCAAWCRLCDAYAEVLKAVIAEFDASGARLSLRWIDIEDEADLIGDLDVETFPTLLIIGPEGVRFAGPVTPQPDTLRRLLRSTVVQAQTQAEQSAISPAMQALSVRIGWPAAGA